MRKSDGFIICLGAFLVQFAVFGIHNNFGLIFKKLLEEFNVEASQAGKIYLHRVDCLVTIFQFG